MFQELSEAEYRNWLVEHEKAEISLRNRDELLQISYCKIEREMELLGATGIEDRLQEGVPEAIASLRAAGLKVWVLTGDKQVNNNFDLKKIIECYPYMHFTAFWRKCNLYGRYGIMSIML